MASNVALKLRQEAKKLFSQKVVLVAHETLVMNYDDYNQEPGALENPTVEDPAQAID